MESNTLQYYVKVSGGTINGKTADWLNPGNNTFKPDTKADYTESAWSGQTAEVVGNIRYHKKHVYTPKNKIVNITGPISIVITASDYTETINQVDRQQYQSKQVAVTGTLRYYLHTDGHNGTFHRWYCNQCGALVYNDHQYKDMSDQIHTCGYANAESWVDI